MVSIVGKIGGFFSKATHSEKVAKDKPAPLHLLKFESVNIDTLWGKVEGLGTHITKKELEQAILFAKAQARLTGTTRFKSRKHKLPFAVTVTDSGALYLSIGKKHKSKEEGGYLGMGSFKTVHKALKIEGEFAEVVAELTVQKDLPAALKEYHLMSKLQSPHIMDPGEAPLSYSAKKMGKLAMFQQLMDSDASALNGNKLTFKEKLKVVQDVAEGLAEIHRKGISHYDLQAGNILILGRGEEIQGKVSDFGLARQQEPDAPPMSSVFSRASDVLDIGFMLRDAFKGEAHIPEDVKELFVQIVRRDYQNRPTAEEVAVRLAKIRAV